MPVTPEQQADIDALRSGAKSDASSGQSMGMKSPVQDLSCSRSWLCKSDRLHG